MPPSNDFNIPADEEDNRKGQPDAQYLVGLAKKSIVRSFTSDNMQPFITFKVADHEETHSLDHGLILHWLQKIYAENNRGSIIGTLIIERALQQLRAEAVLSDDYEPVYVRIGHADDKVYIDTGWKDWSVFEIDCDGFRTITYSKCPVTFRRSEASKELPTPIKGGSIDSLRQFLNFPDDDDWLMFKSILVAPYCPEGGLPVVSIHGEQGTAKSTVAKVIKRLIDPSVTDLRSAPRSERDIFIAADREFLLSFENVSRIRPQMSDSLCKLSTGATFTTRELYKNKGEMLISAKRMILLNGIGHLVSRPDLQDRQIDFILPPISEANRSTSSALWKNIEQVLPEVFGAILMAISTGLRNLSSTQLQETPRMADYATWVVACSGALGFDSQYFLDVYRSRRSEALKLTADSNSFIKALIEHVESVGGFTCTASELLDYLGAPPEGQSQWWPTGGKGVSSALERYAESLRAAGVQIEQLPRKSNRREIRFSLIELDSD